MKKQSLIFLGSKPIGYRCLQWLIREAEHLHIEIIAVLSTSHKAFDETENVLQLAGLHGIPVIDHPDDMPGADILYSVQYHRILTQSQIGKAAKIAVNLHMAPLPEYRGCNQFSFALLDEKSTFGTTIHRIDHRIDHGDILFEKRFDIPAGCWVQQLYDLTFEASLELFRDTLPAIVSGDYKGIPQKQLEAERGTSLHYRHEMQSIKEIDLNWDAARIERHIRACSMPGFEPPYTVIGNKKIYFCSEWRPGK